jgi:hypothetical protein
MFLLGKEIGRINVGNPKNNKGIIKIVINDSLVIKPRWRSRNMEEKIQ